MFICVYSAHTHTHIPAPSSSKCGMEGGKIGLTVYKVIVCVMGAILKRSKPQLRVAAAGVTFIGHRKYIQSIQAAALFELVLAICLPFSSGVFSTCLANTNLQIVRTATGAPSSVLFPYVRLCVKSINFCRHSPFHL